MQVQWWGYHEVVGTLKLYHMVKNLIAIIALKGNGDRKTIGVSTCAQARWLVLTPSASAHTQESPCETLII